MNLKNIFSCILCFTLIYAFTFSTFAYSNDIVTDRELVLLTLLGYSNNQKEDVTAVNLRNHDDNIKFFKYDYDLSEVEGWKMVDHEIEENIGDKHGFSAATYKKEDDVVVVFRGTDSGLFAENKWYLCPFIEHPQAKYANNYMDKILKSDFIDKNTKLYLTGHSLGGYLCLNVIGKFYVNDEFKNKFIRTVTFNGLGIGCTESKKIKKVLSTLTDSQIINYRMEWDVPSLIGNHFTKVVTLKINKPYRSLLYKMVFAHAIYTFLEFHDIGSVDN